MFEFNVWSAISRSLAELTKGTVNSVLPGPTETESLKGFISLVNGAAIRAEGGTVPTIA
jgi:3-oxoacyl-[acyl-carrier protein] reductase